MSKNALGGEESGGGLGGRFRWDVCETLGHMLRRLETGYRGNTVSSSVENSVGERHRTERRGEEKRGKERRGNWAAESGFGS